jgi:hypothetical protein
MSETPINPLRGGGWAGKLSAVLIDNDLGVSLPGCPRPPDRHPRRGQQTGPDCAVELRSGASDNLLVVGGDKRALARGEPWVSVTNLSAYHRPTKSGRTRRMPGCRQSTRGCLPRAAPGPDSSMVRPRARSHRAPSPAINPKDSPHERGTSRVQVKIAEACPDQLVVRRNELPRTGPE